MERTREALGELMGRQLGDLRLAVMMLDGLELKGRMMIVALGITTQGVKIPLELWEGSTEHATVATALLADLVERGLDPEQGMLFAPKRHACLGRPAVVSDRARLAAASRESNTLRLRVVAWLLRARSSTAQTTRQEARGCRTVPAVVCPDGRGLAPGEALGQNAACR